MYKIITKASLLVFIIKWSGPDVGNLYFSNEMLAMLTHSLKLPKG